MASGRTSRPKNVASRRMIAMPSIHAVVPRQLSNTWSLVTAGSGSSVGGPFGGADDVPRGASPSSGRVLDDAGAGGGVDGVASEDGMATSDPLFSALGRRLRFPATTRPGGARVGADPAARDAPRKDASGVAAAGWKNEGSRDHARRAKPPSAVRRCPSTILGETSRSAGATEGEQSPGASVLESQHPSRRLGGGSQTEAREGGTTPARTRVAGARNGARPGNFARAGRSGTRGPTEGPDGRFPEARRRLDGFGRRLGRFVRGRPREGTSGRTGRAGRSGREERARRIRRKRDHERRRPGVGRRRRGTRRGERRRVAGILLPARDGPRRRDALRGVRGSLLRVGGRARAIRIAGPTRDAVPEGLARQPGLLAQAQAKRLLQPDPIHPDPGG